MVVPGGEVAPSDEGDFSERSKLEGFTAGGEVEQAAAGAEPGPIAIPEDEEEEAEASGDHGEPSVEVSFQLELPEGTPQVSTFDDHFTLQVPSSVIRYRSAKAAARGR